MITQKSTTPKKPQTQLHLVTLLSYIFPGTVLLLLSDAIFDSNINKQKHSCFRSKAVTDEILHKTKKLISE